MEEESGGVVRRSYPYRLSACLSACISDFNEEEKKKEPPLKGDLSVQVHTLHIP